jgi:ABC-type branched-subunit amino acid transport system substrate-binding protein
VRARVLLVVLVLAGTACGTRADFSAAPEGLTTTYVEEVVTDGGAPVAVAPSDDGSSRGSAGRARTIRPPLRAGSGVRGGKIVVGGLFPMSGGLSALGVPPAKAAQAYFRHVNANGGIGGYEIDFRICDDKADPNLSAACVDRLVNQGAFIIGPSFTPFSGNVVPILQRKGVPWIGYDGINVEGFSSPLVVTVGASIQTMGHALLPYWFRQVEATKGRAPERLGVVYLDAAPSRTYVAEARDVICPRLGCEIVAEQRVTYFDLDYSSICLKMRAAEVDGVWIVTDPASAVKLLVQCRELRYKPALGGFLGQHGVYLDLTMEQSGAFADGMIANSALLPPSVDVPATREMKKIVATYERDVDYGYFTVLGYASARMTVDVLRAALRRDPKLSRASTLDAAATIRGYDCHGLCRDVNLAAPAAVHGGNHTVWMVRSRYSRSDPDQWVFDGGPVDAWRAETWPRQGRP